MCKSLRVDRLHFLTQELFNLGVTNFEVKFKLDSITDSKAIQERLSDCGAIISLVDITDNVATYRLMEQ